MNKNWTESERNPAKEKLKLTKNYIFWQGLCALFFYIKQILRHFFSECIILNLFYYTILYLWNNIFYCAWTWTYFFVSSYRRMMTRWAAFTRLRRRRRRTWWWRISSHKLISPENLSRWRKDKKVKKYFLKIRYTPTGICLLLLLVDLQTFMFNINIIENVPVRTAYSKLYNIQWWALPPLMIYCRNCIVAEPVSAGLFFTWSRNRYLKTAPGSVPPRKRRKKIKKIVNIVKSRNKLLKQNSFFFFQCLTIRC